MRNALIGLGAGLSCLIGSILIVAQAPPSNPGSHVVNKTTTHTPTTTFGGVLTTNVSDPEMVVHPDQTFVTVTSGSFISVPTSSGVTDASGSTRTSSVFTTSASSGLTLTVTEVPHPGSTVTVPTVTVTLLGPPPLGWTPPWNCTTTLAVPGGASPSGSLATLTITQGAAPVGAVVTLTIPNGSGKAATVVLTVTVPDGSPDTWSTIITAPGEAGTPAGPIVTVTLSPSPPAPVSNGPFGSWPAGSPMPTFGHHSLPSSASFPLVGPGSQPTIQTSPSSVDVITYTVLAHGTTPAYTGTFTLYPGVPESESGPSQSSTQPSIFTTSMPVSPGSTSASQKPITVEITSTLLGETLTFAVPIASSTPYSASESTGQLNTLTVHAGPSPVTSGVIILTLPLGDGASTVVTVAVPTRLSNGHGITSTSTVTVPGSGTSSSPVGPSSVVTFTVPPTASGLPIVFTVTIPVGTSSPESPNGGSSSVSTASPDFITITLEEFSTQTFGTGTENVLAATLSGSSAVFTVPVGAGEVTSTVTPGSSGTIPIVVTAIPSKGSPFVVTIPLAKSSTVPSGSSPSVFPITPSSRSPLVVTVSLPSGSPVVLTIPLNGGSQGISTVTTPVDYGGITESSVPSSPVGPVTILASAITITETVSIGTDGSFTVIPATTQLTLTPSSAGSSPSVSALSLRPTVLTYIIPVGYGQNSAVVTIFTKVPPSTHSNSVEVLTFTLPAESATPSAQAPSLTTIWPAGLISSPGVSPIVITIQAGTSANIPTTAAVTSSSTCTSEGDSSAVLPDQGSTTGMTLPSEITLWPVSSSIDTRCTTLSTVVRPSNKSGADPDATSHFSVVSLTLLSGSTTVLTISLPPGNTRSSSTFGYRSPLHSTSGVESIGASETSTVVDPVLTFATLATTSTSLNATSSVATSAMNTTLAKPTSTASSSSPVSSTSALNSTSSVGNTSSATLNATTPVSASSTLTFTSTSSAATGSSLPVESCGAIGDRGKVQITFDDILPNNGSESNASFSRAIPSAYHRFHFSNGFSVVGSSASHYLPSSGNQMVAYDVSAGPVAQIGLNNLQSNQCFRFDFLGLSLGCNSTGSTCDFSILGLQWNGTNEVLEANKTVQVQPCTGLANCTLIHQLLDLAAASQFTNLTSINITLTIDGEPQTWWADDLSLVWTDNSCKAASCRALVPDVSKIGRRRPYSPTKRIFTLIA